MKGNAVVVTCKGNERGISVCAPNGTLATRVLLAALDVYDEESKRLAIIKESAERIRGRLHPVQSEITEQISSRRNRK